MSKRSLDQTSIKPKTQKRNKKSRLEQIENEAMGRENEASQQLLDNLQGVGDILTDITGIRDVERFYGRNKNYSNKKKKRARGIETEEVNEEPFEFYDPTEAISQPSPPSAQPWPTFDDLPASPLHLENEIEQQTEENNWPLPTSYEPLLDLIEEMSATGNEELREYLLSLHGLLSKLRPEEGTGTGTNRRIFSILNLLFFEEQILYYNNPRWNNRDIADDGEDWGIINPGDAILKETIIDNDINEMSDFSMNRRNNRGRLRAIVSASITEESANINEKIIMHIVNKINTTPGMITHNPNTTFLRLFEFYPMTAKRSFNMILNYELITHHNNYFAGLEFSTNARDSNMFKFDMKKTVLRLIQLFCTTGALGGQDIDTVERNYARFIIYINTHIPSGGIHQWKKEQPRKLEVCTFNSNEIRNLNTEQNQVIFEKALDKLEAHLIEIYYSDGDEEAPIFDFNDNTTQVTLKFMGRKRTELPTAEPYQYFVEDYFYDKDFTLFAPREHENYVELEEQANPQRLPRKGTQSPRKRRTATDPVSIIEQADNRVQDIQKKFTQNLAEMIKLRSFNPNPSQPPPVYINTTSTTTTMTTEGVTDFVRPSEIDVEGTDIDILTEDQERETDYFKDRFSCRIDPHDKLEAALLRIKHIIEPEGDNTNNCVIKCIAMGSKRMTTYNEDIIEIRDLIEHHEGVKIEEIETIATYYQVSVKCYAIIKCEKSYRELSKVSQSIKKIASIKTIGAKEIVNIFLHKGHAYLITNTKYIISKLKCANCAQWINSKTLARHNANCKYCANCKKAYNNRKEHICDENRKQPLLFNRKAILKKPDKPGDWKVLRNIKPSKRFTSDKSIYCADFEAFPDFHNDDNFATFAARVVNVGTNVGKTFYGPTGLADYLNYLQDIKGYLYYYNGSGFDNFLHLQGMINNGFEVNNKSFIKSNGRIIGFNHHSKLKVRDLYLYIGTSLKRACKEWGVPLDLSKKDFDHNLIRSWKDTETHKDEIIEYLHYDVTSLVELYKIYSRAMYECFSLDINRSVTPSHYSLLCWASECEYIKDIYIPHVGEEEDDDRDAYRGGRVTPQYKQFESEDLAAYMNGYMVEDEVKDYLIDADVNSLYPSVQKGNTFACGKWKYKYFKKNDDPRIKEKHIEEQLSELDFINDLRNEELIKRRMYKVDVKCPTDLLTPFLLSRDNKTGKLEQNLHRKYEQWYWGVELIEAIILGYKVLHIHTIKEFEKAYKLFDKYVTKCWQGRIDNPGPCVKNLVFKKMMNSLTGKFGQRTNTTSSYVSSSFEAKTEKSLGSHQEFTKMMDRIKDFTAIYNNDGINTAIIVEVENENLDPSYPIYLSAQILAYSRVAMSKIMRILNSYLDPNRAFYYTDTDALVLPAECIPILEKTKLIGKELGQLSCDLGDFKNNKFAKIVKAIFAAPKGPYSIVYIENETLLEKTRVKGMPHTNLEFAYEEDIKRELNGLEENQLHRVLEWFKNPSTNPIPSDLIGNRIYCYHDLTNGEDKSDDYYARHINFNIIDQVLTREGELCCYFGNMLKKSSHDNDIAFSVKPNVIRRYLCKTNWWDKGFRFYKPNEDSVFDLTYPAGYNNGNNLEVRKRIEYETEALLRLAPYM